MTFSSCNVLKFVSISNQECKVRPAIMNINSNEPLFQPYSILVSKRCGSYNNINDSYTRLCVPDVVKNINIEVSNFMSRINRTRHVSWNEICACSIIGVFNLNVVVLRYRGL